MTTTEASRSSKDIEKEIADLCEMEAKKVAELEQKHASLPSEVDWNKLIIDEATGKPEAQIRLVDIRATKQEVHGIQDLLQAIQKALPELRREQRQAELIEAMQQEKRLRTMNQPTEEKIRQHLREAAKLTETEWIPRAKEAYSLRTKYRSPGRTPKAQASDWLREYFGRFLHPYVDLPPKK